MKSHIKLFKIEPSTKRGRHLQSIDSGIARDGKKFSTRTDEMQRIKRQNVSREVSKT